LNVGATVADERMGSIAVSVGVGGDSRTVEITFSGQSAHVTLDAAEEIAAHLRRFARLQRAIEAQRALNQGRHRR